ncbi:MAG: hypothetical protein ABI321_07620 [Polyangia bacterium]
MVGVVALLAACHHDSLQIGADAGGQHDDGGSHLGDAGDFSVACNAIKDEQSCRGRADCIADTCTACSCTPAFAACRASADPQTQCPALGCPSPECCKKASDCSGGSMCQIPPLQLGCGVCDPQPSTCDKDSDCAGSQGPSICAPTRCGCTASLSCQAGCTSNDDCQEIEQCGSDHRCKPRPCDATCTGNYACDTGSATCVRKACSSDHDCAVPGFCIEGACSKFVGQCVQPAA